MRNNVAIWVCIWPTTLKLIAFWRHLFPGDENLSLDIHLAEIIHYALLGYNAASSDNFLPSYRDNLSAPTSRFKNTNGYKRL